MSGDGNGAGTAGAQRRPERPSNQSGQRPEPRQSGRSGQVAGQVVQVGMRVPPHSIEAEQGVLGSILIAPNEAIPECMEKIPSPDFFFVPSHGMIWLAALEMFEAKKPIDMIGFTQFMRDRNELETVGGPAFVTMLFDYVPTAANLGYYLETVRDKFVLRSIIRSCTEAVRKAYEEQGEINVFLDETLGQLALLAQERVSESSLQHIWPGVERVMQKFETAFYHRGQEVTDGLPTGFYDLDRILNGLKGQQMITFAALTSHGKSAIANNILDYLAVEKKIPCGKWSLEMSYDEESERFVCARSHESLQRLKDGHLSDKAFEEIPKRLAPFRHAPLWIDDTRGLSIMDMRARVMRAVRRHGLKCVIIDYLGLLNSSTKRALSNRAIEISEITYGLKTMAKELDIPVILAAQLNRESDRRASVFRRPKLSDLKDSSSIEQDSDVVIFVWRPVRFVEFPADRERLEESLELDEVNDRLREKVLEQEEIDGQPAPFSPLTLDDYAELIVAKQRNGPVTDKKTHVRLRYIGDQTRFENVTPKMWSNNPKERQG